MFFFVKLQVITEIVTEPKLDKRVKIMKQFIKVRFIYEKNITQLGPQKTREN